MMPLLHRNLRRADCFDAVPDDAAAALRRHFQRNAAANLVLARDLIKILALLASHDIPALPFKGPVLAAGVYGDLSLREAGDLDILLREDDVPAATDLLLSNGYRRLGKNDASVEQAEPGAHWEVQFTRDDGTVGVELQWRIEPHWQVAKKGGGATAAAFLLQPERLWKRRQSLPLAGATVPCLAPEDLLLVLCIHGTKHLWTRLAWICDVAEAVRASPDLNWEYVLRQARAIDGERMVLLGILLAGELLAAPLPAAIRQQAQADAAVPLLVRQVRGWLFRDGCAAAAPGLEEEFRFHRRLRKRLQSRLPYDLHYLAIFAHTAVTPTDKDRAQLPLPPFLSFLYYLLRPIRLARGAVAKDARSRPR